MGKAWRPMASPGWQHNCQLTLCSFGAGNGLKHGRILYVEDQVQEFKVQIEILHKVSKRLAIMHRKCHCQCQWCQRGRV